MSSTGPDHGVQYDWRDRNAKKTFDDLARQITSIWKEAASGAR